MPTQQFAGSRAEAEGGQLSQQLSVKLLNFPHGYKYFWGIELILPPYSMLSWASLSALWKWYNMGLESMPRDHPNPLRPGVEPAQACSDGCRTFTSKPWPRGLHGPHALGLHRGSTFIFRKFHGSLQSIVFTYQSIILLYFFFFFPFLIAIVLAYPAILVIQYFHKNHMHVWTQCHFDSLLFYYVELMALFHTI